MKKIIISTFLITSVSLNFSLATEESFINNVRNFFTSEKKTLDVKQDVKLKKQDVLDTDTEKTTNETVALEIKNATNTEEVKEEIICENKTKLLIKKDKISKQIKNQIREKNKLSDGLLEVSANFATDTKEKIEDTLIKLEEEVNITIKIEKNILNILSSSTESACDAKSKKINMANSKIKNLELENEKQLEKINKFIKKEIKDLLTELKEVETSEK